MKESKGRRTPTETEQRLRRGVGEEIVVLEDGDPLEAAQGDQADWDWDGEVLSGERHCAACGAWGPVFRLEDASRVCAACAWQGQRGLTDKFALRAAGRRSCARIGRVAP